MSVYPEFLQYIHDEGLYVYGYNYVEMYNVMVYTLTYNIIPTTNFIYTYQQVDRLYEHLEELLTPIEDSDPDTNETNEPNQNNQNNQHINIMIENPDNFDDIYEDEVVPIPDPMETEYTQTQTQTQNQTQTDAQIAFNNYIQIINNAANINHTNTNQMNQMNQMNQINTNQIYYTNLTYNNITTYNNMDNTPHNNT